MFNLKLVIVGTVALVASALHPVSEPMVNSIKEKTRLWEPIEHQENPFKDYTKEDLMGMLGTYIVPSNKEYNQSEVLEAIPDAFDARDQWPLHVHAIRNQQNCGSCWAFGATEAFSDRFAIAS